MEYGFNVEIAQKLGVNEAIVIRNFQHWLKKNEANNANFHHGRYWTYNSIGAFCKIFPFWTEHQIRNILKKLMTDGILIKGNFNKSPYDKTIWYSIDEEVLNKLLSEHEEADEPQKYNDKIENSPESTETVDLVNLPNRCGKNAKSICENSQIDVGNFTDRSGNFTKPIPYVNTYSKPDVNTHTHERVCDGFSEVRSVSEPERANSPVERSNPRGFKSERMGYSYPNNPVLPSSPEVTMFCEDYKTFKNPDFEPSSDDRAEIAKTLTKNGGYDTKKRQYWQDVFKKASRGWKIAEKDVARIVPCSLDRVLAEHSRIKANELGLLPPKKDAPKIETPAEPEIMEDEAIVEAVRQRAHAAYEKMKRMSMPIR